MVGIVTIDDAMDVLVDETTEDMEIMNALSPSEQPYFETGVFRHAKKSNCMVIIFDVIRHTHPDDYCTL